MAVRKPVWPHLLPLATSSGYGYLTNSVILSCSTTVAKLGRRVYLRQGLRRPEAVTEHLHNATIF
ncbi:hypothetical protein PK28_02825 [Hymenobacter sp. DG25B]|uniref:hypothetical protein n=1 Tax=Hymenobacter sp. DG25B TaxID=1385664 RepID=UPI000540E12F|nr:hypothetical protein [Hymenobacter sp. DG25B]AIZ62886.1 hypothetical protein PK28_02825 [Hymenobacter sp. DG25B]